jgi:5'(3')-deoxyribonucleotidase
LQKPSLAIDFDGVIAETLSLKSAWIARHIGLEIAPTDCSKSRCESRIGSENYRRMSSELGYADTLACPPLDGAEEGLRRLAEVFSISVYTARPEEKTCWARQWFKHQGLEGFIDDVISTYGRSKAAMALASASHALVDNDIRHLREETPTSTRRIFFCPTADGDVEGLATVRNWAELVDALLPCQLDAA